MSPKQQPTTDTAPAVVEHSAVEVKTCEEQVAAVQADAATAAAEANALVTDLLAAIKLALSRAPYDELKAPLHTARRQAGAFLGVDEK